jgi:hypothetical protein
MGNTSLPVMLHQSKKKHNILIFIRASDSSICEKYNGFKSSADLHFSFYNLKKGSSIDEKDVSYSEGGWSKYHAFYHLFNEHLPLKQYDYYWFLDEDLFLSFQSEEIICSRIEQGGFDIAQLALCENSHSRWVDLFQHNSSVNNRLTNFIEVMAPIFMKSSLEHVIHTFPMSLSTWGLDHYWSKKTSNLIVFNDLKMSHLGKPDTKNGKFYMYLREIGINPYLENLKMILYAFFSR